MSNLLNEKIERRKFLKVAGAGISLFALEELLAKVRAEEVLPKPGTKRRYAMVI